MIDSQHIKKFVTLCHDLNTLIYDIHQYCPTAEYFLAAGTMNLMLDDTQKVRQDGIVESVIMNYMDGGDW
jgi:hypothetical protein